MFSILVPRGAVAALAAGLLLVIGACGSNQGGTGVRVVEPRLVQTPNGERSFTGTLVNDRPAALSIAEIEVALYDEGGSPVEQVRIEVEDVPARDSVKFREPIDSDRAFSQAQVQRILTP